MGKGKRYELNTKKAINADTRPCVKAHRPDYSGSSVGEVADLMVVWQENRYEPQRPCGHPERKVAYLELKKRSAKAGNRATVAGGSSDGDSGLDELFAMRRQTPAWTDRYFVVKFDNRAPITLELEALLHWLLRDDATPRGEGWGEQHADDDIWSLEYKAHGARVTPSGNISMRKPTLDNWESSQAARADHLEILKRIGVEPYYWKGE